MAEADAMSQLRVAVRTAMRDLTVEQAAGLAGCSERTLYRILSGGNTSIITAGRIVERLGGHLEIRLRAA